VIQSNTTAARASGRPLSQAVPQANPREEELLGKAYDARLMRRLWDYMRPHRALFWAAFALLPIAAGLDLLGPLLLKYGIDHSILGTGSPLGLVAGAYLVTLLLQYAASYWQLWLSTLLGQRAMRSLRQHLYSHVLTLRASFFDRTPIGRLLTRMTNDVEAINEMFTSGFVSLAGDALKLVGIIIVLLRTDVHLSLVTFATVPVLVALVALVRPAMREAFRQTRTQLARLNAYLAEHLSGMKVVQLFLREERVSREFNERSDLLRAAFHEAIRWDAILYASVEALGTLTVAAILWYGGGELLHGALTFGTLVLFKEYIDRFFAPIRDFSQKYTIAQQAMAASERIFGLLDRTDVDAPATALGQIPVQGEPSAGSGEPRGSADPAVRFEGVSFAYRDGEDVVADLSLEVARGETVAIVGPTGAGKSTIIKLLTRLYEPRAGSILLAGTDVRALARWTLRRRIVVVTQDVFLFAGTLRENLAVGASDAADKHAVSDDALLAALGRVGAQSILARPGGLDQLIAERGANLSGGEKQLLSFARALVRAPEVLVLDEATASVDPEAEARIERGLAALMQGRTSLVIAHRLSTIQRANRIVVLANGRVVESGPHAQLVAQNGLYARLYRLQKSDGANASDAQPDVGSDLETDATAIGAKAV
jgi:ATP-binding cassette subfamily B protein